VTIAPALRPYLLLVGFAVYIPLILLADAHDTFWQQCGLGVVTFGILWLATRWSPLAERRTVWLCVAVATGYEVIGSIVWGLYRYKFHNLPLYVPPGHGLVYLFGLTAARTAFMQTHGRLVGRVALFTATTWALAGLTVLPLVTGRVDVEGALCLPIFAWFVLRSPRGAVFIGIFFATSMLEIVGTTLGTWRWAATMPYLGIPAGNPPSVIAGGYCVIDGTVLLLAGALDRVALPRLLPRLRSVAAPAKA
jgi:hypothetical protein